MKATILMFLCLNTFAVVMLRVGLLYMGTNIRKPHPIFRVLVPWHLPPDTCIALLKTTYSDT